MLWCLVPEICDHGHCGHQWNMGRGFRWWIMIGRNIIVGWLIIIDHLSHVSAHVSIGVHSVHDWKHGQRHGLDGKSWLVMLLQIRNRNYAYNDIPTNHNSPSKPGLCPCSIGVHSVHGHISQEPDITAWSCLVFFLGIIGVLSPFILPVGIQDVPEKRSHFSLKPKGFTWKIFHILG